MATTIQTTLALAAASATNIAASQSPGAGVVLINGSAASGGVATLDTARRVLLTSGGNDSGINFTVNGTNLAGNAITETLAGGNAGAVQTAQDFKTVTSATHTGSVAGTLSIGTNQVASSPWFIIDRDQNPVNLGIAVVVTGTVSFTVEYTYDDPNKPYTGLYPTPFPITAFTAKSANTDGAMVTPIFAIRLTQNSFTSPATSKMIVAQSVVTPS